MTSSKDLRDFLFRGLMFETDSSMFQSGAVEVGSSSERSEWDLLKEKLAPFGIPMRRDAIYMSRLYATIYCFENSVREFIKESLSENYGAEWTDYIPNKAYENGKSRQTQALKDSWLEGEKSDIFGFIDFGAVLDNLKMGYEKDNEEEPLKSL